MDLRIEEVFETLSERIRENPASASMDNGELRIFIEGEVYRYSAEKAFLNLSERAEIASEIFSSMRGFGILDRILADSSITEIMINGPDSVFVEREGKTRKIDCGFKSEEKLEDIIQRIVGLGGREVNLANPVVDTRLPDGSRVNVVLPPVSLCGAVMTIRKFSKEPLTVNKLISYGSLTEEAGECLEKLVKAKYNIFISGGTGSGKTSFLNAIADFIPGDERVITIEDSAELKIKNIENLVSLETRNSNSAGNGAVTVRDLIKTSLRMRPERIIVGEVRGGEALDMLQAMNTGHDGSISTGHANSCYDLLSRLETMVLMGTAELPLDAVRAQIASAIDIIVHLSRFRDGSRKVAEISEVSGIEEGTIKLNPLYIFEEDSDSTGEHVSGKLKRTENKLIHGYKLKRCGIDYEV